MRKLILNIAICLSIISSFSASAQNITNYVSAELTASKRRVYEGEPFEIFLTVNSHAVTLDQEFSINPFKSSAIKELETETSYYPVERKLSGNRIEETRKFSWSAVAVSTGRVDLSGPLEFGVISRDTRLFFSRPKRTAFTIEAGGDIVDVIPLPEEGRPDNFSGAVGSFSFKAEVSPLQAAPGDVLKIRTQISGSGLLDDVTPPLLKKADGLKVYDPRRISTEPELIYEQQVIPQKKEALNLPEIAFSYFDTASGSYRTLEQGPFLIEYQEKSAQDDVRFRPDEPDATASKAKVPGPPIPESSALAASVVSLFIVLLSITVLRRRAPAPAKYIAIIAGIILLTSLSYVGVAKSGYFRRDIFTVTSQQKGMISPSMASVQTMLVPTGAYVQYLACDGDWALVRYSGSDCWIPEKTLASEDKSKTNTKK